MEDDVVEYDLEKCMFEQTIKTDNVRHLVYVLLLLCCFQGFSLITCIINLCQHGAVLQLLSSHF